MVHVVVVAVVLSEDHMVSEPVIANHPTTCLYKLRCSGTSPGQMGPPGTGTQLDPWTSTQGVGRHIITAMPSPKQQVVTFGRAMHRGRPWPLGRRPRSGMAGVACNSEYYGTSEKSVCHYQKVVTRELPPLRHRRHRRPADHRRYPSRTSSSPPSTAPRARRTPPRCRTRRPTPTSARGA